jgi:hypothetical protein
MSDRKEMQCNGLALNMSCEQESIALGKNAFKKLYADDPTKSASSRGTLAMPFQVVLATVNGIGFGG